MNSSSRIQKGASTSSKAKKTASNKNFSSSSSEQSYSQSPVVNKHYFAYESEIHPPEARRLLSKVHNLKDKYDQAPTDRDKGNHSRKFFEMYKNNVNTRDFFQHPESAQIRIEIAKIMLEINQADRNLESFKRRSILSLSPDYNNGSMSVRARSNTTRVSSSVVNRSVSASAPAAISQNEEVAAPAKKKATKKKAAPKQKEALAVDELDDIQAQAPSPVTVSVVQAPQPSTHIEASEPVQSSPPPTAHIIEQPVVPDVQVSAVEPEEKVAHAAASSVPDEHTIDPSQDDPNALTANILLNLPDYPLYETKDEVVALSDQEMHSLIHLMVQHIKQSIHQDSSLASDTLNLALTYLDLKYPNGEKFIPQATISLIEEASNLFELEQQKSTSLPNIPHYEELEISTLSHQDIYDLIKLIGQHFDQQINVDESYSESAYKLASDYLRIRYPEGLKSAPVPVINLMDYMQQSLREKGINLDLNL